MQAGARCGAQATTAALLDTLPRNSNGPAWVVATEYGRKVLVWDENGRQLSELAVTAEASPLAVVDGPQDEASSTAATARRVRSSRQGAVSRSRSGDFALSTAAAVRFSTSEDPDLVLVGSTDRDTSRYRLLIVNSKLQAVYDEIFDRYPRVLVARQADGSDTLFVDDGQRPSSTAPR